MSRRVVITGLGSVTPIGGDVPTTWQALLEGKSGAGPITRFDSTPFTVHFACEVKDFDPLLYMDRKDAKRLDPYARFALAASVQAMRDAGLENGGFDPEQFGVILGSGIGGLASFEEQHRQYMQRGASKISPFFIPMFILDMAAGHVSMKYGLTGPNYAVVSACATSGHAIGDAMRLIQYGDADLMLAGGSEAAVTEMSVGGFASMQAMSTRNDSPETASRPFDSTRDGFVLGEGSGVVLLEELEHAKARGAKIYGEIVGYGATADAYHITQPAPEGAGAQRSMRRALKDAGVGVEEVQYINAHGTSTPFNDKNETTAIKAVFGDHAYRLNVSSTKSATGHTLGASGGIEFILCAMAVNHGIVPPTINYSSPDPDCDLNYTPNVPVKREIEVAISNSFGFGGHNCTLALRKFKA